MSSPGYVGTEDRRSPFPPAFNGRSIVQSCQNGRHYLLSQLVVLCDGSEQRVQQSRRPDACSVLCAVGQECEDLMAQGMTRSAAGSDPFVGSSRRLGGLNRGALPAAASLAAAAAERRMRQAVLPSGPQRVGGNTSLMRRLSPAQAAAMAAELRMQDNAWCGGEWEGTPDSTAEEDWETPESRAGGDAEQPLASRENTASERREGLGSGGTAAAPGAAGPPSLASKRPAPDGARPNFGTEGGTGVKKVKSFSSTTWQEDGSTWSCVACTFLNLVSWTSVRYWIALFLCVHDFCRRRYA